MATTNPTVMSIPNYHQACLAAASSDSSSQSFYLVGSSTQGSLDIHFVPDIFATQVKYVANQNDVGAWNIEARKACFKSPSSKDANDPIKITQFGLTTTAMTIAYPNGTTYKATDTGSLNRYDISHFPTADPLLALGTYTPSTGTTSSGHTIVFDKAGLGLAYIATGNSVTNISSTVPSMTLSPGYAVNMNNIVITEDAIPVTMSTTGYILDRIAD
ncbi:hypothetical protein BGZ96_010375 [Linnemannia gamsii]|uniref:Uncharacterized protein n=1 Tax=Linnemannia gamsii TaxID=64522 RepID=A0ABQ7JUB5_9FUNG|nr:hypothetical protein BGZ96_010375 [Linnemannia gamsii]